MWNPRLGPDDEQPVSWRTQSPSAGFVQHSQIVMLAWSLTTWLLFPSLSPHFFTIIETLYIICVCCCCCLVHCWCTNVFSTHDEVMWDLVEIRFMSLSPLSCLLSAFLLYKPIIKQELGHVFYPLPQCICVNIRYAWLNVCKITALVTKCGFQQTSQQYLSPPDLQSSSRTPTSHGQRGLRLCQCGARRWGWSPTGLHPWRLRSNAGAPFLPKPPVSPAWTRQGSPSMFSHMVSRCSWNSSSLIMCLFCCWTEFNFFRAL